MSSPTDDVLSSRSDSPDPYEQLPEAVRQYYSRSEYLWLTDDQKAHLIEAETEPEWT